MRFAPEIHEVNLRGTKKPIIASKMAKSMGQAMRDRLQEKLNFLNAGQFGTLADADGMPGGHDPAIIGNLQIGASFEQ